MVEHKQAEKRTENIIHFNALFNLTDPDQIKSTIGNLLHKAFYDLFNVANLPRALESERLSMRDIVLDKNKITVSFNVDGYSFSYTFNKGGYIKLTEENGLTILEINTGGYLKNKSNQDEKPQQSFFIGNKSAEVYLLEYDSKDGKINSENIQDALVLFRLDKIGISFNGAHALTKLDEMKVPASICAGFR